MDFLHTYPNARLRYFAGTMKLAVEFNEEYLILPGAKSRYAGQFYLESMPKRLNYNRKPNNVPILTECRDLKNVVCLAAEAECGGLFHNSQTVI